MKPPIQFTDPILCQWNSAIHILKKIHTYSSHRKHSNQNWYFQWHALDISITSDRGKHFDENTLIHHD